MEENGGGRRGRVRRGKVLWERREINKEREGEWEKRESNRASRISQTTVMSIIRYINHTSTPTHTDTLLHTHTNTATHAQSRVFLNSSITLFNIVCSLHPWRLARTGD